MAERATWALEDAEARFRAAFEDAPIGMSLIDLDGRFLQVNRALCRLLGRSQAELLQSRWQDVTHPNDLALQEAHERALLEGRARTYQLEKRYIRPDGAERWALLARSVVTDHEGRPRYLIAQVMDITDRVHAEDALRAREEETRRILQTAQDAYVSMDVSGRITDWNRQAEVIFGWSRAEALGRPLAETIIPPQYREAHRRGLQRLLETGEGPVLNRRLELTALRRDGTEFPVELTIWDVGGSEGYRFNGLIHDISPRVEAQAQLGRQKEELEALHESMLDVIRRLEPTSLLEAVLARAAALMGTEHGFLYDRDEAADELEMRAGIGFFTDHVGYRLERGQGLTGRAWGLGTPQAVNDYQNWEGRRPGFDFIKSAVALPLYTGEEIVGVIGLVHVEEGREFGPEDVDLLTRFGRVVSLALENARLYASAQDELRERRRAEKELERSAEELRRANEELKKADEVKSQFVAVASHELRTPLTAVLGFASTLLSHWERLPDEARREHLEVIESQARRLSQLTDELLTLSKLEAGKLEMHREPVEVADAVRHAVSAFVDRVEDIEVSVRHGLTAIADANHLNRILTNYLANAFAYGLPPVLVTARRRNGWVELTVTDSGPGVPASFVPRLFDTFAQADRSEGGTGLGLSIVRGLARAQGGEAWYEPAAPTGASFGVRLPAA